MSARRLILHMTGVADMIVFGGGRIAHSLIRERLVDECCLTVYGRRVRQPVLRPSPAP